MRSRFSVTHRLAALISGLGLSGPLPVSAFTDLVAEGRTVEHSEPTASCPAIAYALQQLAIVEQQRQSFQLDNGLRVILLPDSDASTAAIVTSIQVGARDEPDGETGYAHLFEHLMFRGSKTLPDGAFEQLIDGVGGQHNAETHYDYTSYHLSVPAAALPQMLWQEARRFQAPELNQTTVSSELATVQEEMALRVDNVPFVRSGSTLLFEQLQGSDYDHLILGSTADLLAATPARLQAFYQRHYRPERTVLVVAGNFLPAQIQQQIQRDWSGWQAEGEAATAAPAPLPTARTLSAALVDHRAPWPALAFVWQTVPADHPDAAAVALIQQWLLRGEQAQLRQRLLQQKLLLHSSEFPLQMPKLGLLHFIAVPRAGAPLDAIEQSVSELLNEAANTAPTPALLCELKTAVLRRLIAAAEVPHLLAYRESIDQILWQRSLLYAELQALQVVTPGDLPRVTKQYFLSHQITLRLLPPWYLRWAKKMLEWLPDSWSEALEARVL